VGPAFNLLCGWIERLGCDPTHYSSGTQSKCSCCNHQSMKVQFLSLCAQLSCCVCTMPLVRLTAIMCWLMPSHLPALSLFPSDLCLKLSTFVTLLPPRCRPSSVAILRSDCQGLCNPVVDLPALHSNRNCSGPPGRLLRYHPSYPGHKVFESMWVA
jgi:hypothetical protein